jgi:RNA polymerase sigma-70 factor (ECF subfamily)
MTDREKRLYTELLLIRARQHDKKAFEALVKLWQKSLWLYACRMTSCPETAWDVLQETWVTIIRRLDTLRDFRSFQKWAYRILTSKCVDIVRRKKRQSEANKQYFNKSMADGNRGAEQIENVKNTIEELGHEQRAVLLLRFYEKMSTKRIAAVLKVPEGTVKSRLHRALKELKILLKGTDNG